MSVERRSGADLDARMDAGKPADDARQIALQMKPEGEKVRHHDYARGAFRYQCCDGSIEIGRAATEERSFYQIKSAFALHGFRNAAYGLVG